MDGSAVYSGNFLGKKTSDGSLVWFDQLYRIYVLTISNGDSPELKMDQSEPFILNDPSVTGIENATNTFPEVIIISQEHGSLQITNAYSPADLHIYSPAGQTLLFQKNYSGQPLQIDHLPQGIYLLTLQNDHHVWVEKFWKVN